MDAKLKQGPCTDQVNERSCRKSETGVFHWAGGHFCNGQSVAPFTGRSPGPLLRPVFFFRTGTEIGGMACRKRIAPGSFIADSDQELQPDHPTASGGLPEYIAKGLEQLQQVATEIIEGTAAAEQSVQEKEDEDELADDGDDKNEAM